MNGAQSISTRRAYGLQRICRVWHCARSSVYARRQATLTPTSRRRRGPVGAAPDDVLVSHIRRVLEASPFHGEGYRKAWAKLRVEGIRTSQERVRRLMREHALQAPHRVGQAHGPKAHDGTITTEAPDVMWGTDMTATVTVGEGAAFVFVAVDHCTTECIGLHAAKRGNRFEALEPIRQGVRERFGEIGEGVARGLRLRHDHGSNYLADDFQQEVAFFGIESSPSFVREPEGNGVAERFIRTLKENLLWVRSFDTIEELVAGPYSSSSGRITRKLDVREVPPIGAQPTSARRDRTARGWTPQRRRDANTGPSPGDIRDAVNHPLGFLRITTPVSRPITEDGQPCCGTPKTLKGPCSHSPPPTRVCTRKCAVRLIQLSDGLSRIFPSPCSRQRRGLANERFGFRNSWGQSSWLLPFP